MASVESTIPDLLFYHLGALVLTPALPVAYPNVAFTPPMGPYLRADYMPNTTTRLMIKDGGMHQYMGILQVSVIWPSGVGEILARDVAVKVADHFNDTVRIPMGSGNIRIMKRPNIGRALQDADRIQIPVTIEWVVFA